MLHVSSQNDGRPNDHDDYDSSSSCQSSSSSSSSRRDEEGKVRELDEPSSSSISISTSCCSQCHHPLQQQNNYYIPQNQRKRQQLIQQRRKRQFINWSTMSIMVTAVTTLTYTMPTMTSSFSLSPSSYTSLSYTRHFIQTINPRRSSSHHRSTRTFTTGIYPWNSSSDIGRSSLSTRRMVLTDPDLLLLERSVTSPSKSSSVVTSSSSSSSSSSSPTSTSSALARNHSSSRRKTTSKSNHGIQISSSSSSTTNRNANNTMQPPQHQLPTSLKLDFASSRNEEERHHLQRPKNGKSWSGRLRPSRSNRRSSSRSPPSSSSSSSSMSEGEEDPLWSNDSTATVTATATAGLKNTISTITLSRKSKSKPIGHSSTASSSSSSSITTTATPKVNKSSTMPGFIHPLRSSNQLNTFSSSSTTTTTTTPSSNTTTTSTLTPHQKRLRKSNSEALYINSSNVPDSLLAFTNEIHKVTRLSPAEEMNLGQKCQDALKLQSYYDVYVNEHDVEPSDEEWCRLSGLGNDVEELRRVMEEGIEAKNRLVVANLRMVQGVVNLYIRNGLGSQYNAGDLMQEGTMALIRAAEKYEPNRGFRFSTYAMYWIRAAVKRSQILQSRMINIPQRHHETHKKVMKVEKELKKEYGRKPSSQEIAESAGISESQLERCVHALSQQCFSLDAQIENKLNPNKSSTRKDTLHDLLDARYDDVEYRQLQQLFLKEDLIGTLKRYLTPREVDILLLRYGLIDEKTLPHGFSGPLTIAEVSRLVGLKPDKVRRMINSCLRQLRHLIAHEWEDFESELPA